MIQYAGTVGGLGVAGFTSVPHGVSATFVDNAANKTVDLVITASPGVLWVGNLSNGWDTGVTANWNFGGATT